MLGYDSSTGLFTLFNPWGITPNTSNNTTGGASVILQLSFSQLLFGFNGYDTGVGSTAPHASVKTEPASTTFIEPAVGDSLTRSTTDPVDAKDAGHANGVAVSLKGVVKPDIVTGHSRGLFTRSVGFPGIRVATPTMVTSSKPKFAIV